MKTEVETQKQLAIWAAACAEHVLLVFENCYSADMRPRNAIEAAKAWAFNRMSVSEARKFAFAAHAAARMATNARAKAAARSAGHAAATAHIAAHANHAANYALKASENPADEKSWQTSIAIQ